MIPPNVYPPKTVVYTDPRLEERLREKYVYMCFLPAAEAEEIGFVPGNRLLLKFRDEVIGEGQIILVERSPFAELTPYDAVVGGYDGVEALKGSLKETLALGRRAHKAEIVKILYRWL